MKKLIVIVVIAGLIGAAAYGWSRWSNGADKAPQVETVPAERGQIRVVVASTGRVVSNLDVEIKCKASGQITKLPFDVSNTVKAGELLVELDPVDEQRRVAQAEVAQSISAAKLAMARENLAMAEQALITDTRRAEAQLQAAQSHAADARAKADRTRQLLAKKLASQEDFDTAETAAVQAAADLESAKIRLDELKIQQRALEVKRQEVKQAEATVEADTIVLSIAKDRLRDTKVMAPMDGVVAQRNVEVGQIIASATNNVGGGTSLLTLSDLSHVFVLASVDESDIGKVAVKQSAVVTTDAFAGKRFRGEVVRIATRGVNASNVVTFEVKLEVLGQGKSLLKPEMTANVEIVTAEKQDVVVVPVDAVIRKGRQHFVDVVGPAKESREVEVGLTDGTQTEIVKGLQAGEKIVLHKEGAASRWAGRTPGGPPRGMMGPMGGGRRPR